MGGVSCCMSQWWSGNLSDSDKEDDQINPRPVSSIPRNMSGSEPRGASARASRRQGSPTAPQLPAHPVGYGDPPADGPSGAHFSVGLRKQGSGHLEDIMTVIEKYKMRIKELEDEKEALVGEADLATKKAADLEVALAEERRRRKEEKAIRIEAEEEMKRAQDQRDKLEFELSVIVDEIGLVHHAMED